MKRFSRSLTLGAIALGATAASLLAGQPRGDRDMGGSGHGLRRVEHCLSSIELSADQKTAVEAVVSKNKASLRADVDAWKASQKKLQDDIDRGAEKNVLGQDVLDQEAAAAKVRGSSEALRTQVLAALTPEQQTRFNECAESRRGKGKYPNPPASKP